MKKNIFGNFGNFSKIKGISKLFLGNFKFYQKLSIPVPRFDAKESA